MRFRFSLLLVFALVACAAPSADEAGPPPADYKDVIKANLPETPAGPHKYSYGTNNLDKVLHSFSDRDPIDPYLLHNVEISAPQPGREEFIPGWRVCLRMQLKLPDLHPDLSNSDKIPGIKQNKTNAYQGPDVYPETRRYSAPKTYGYFFVKGTLDKIQRDDAQCANYAYTPWTEMSDIGDKVENKYLHPKWEYGTDYDYLQQTSNGFASLLAKNHYDLRFPYAGGTHAVLGVLRTATGLQLVLTLDRGLIQCKGECDMPARFDDDAIQTLKFTRPDNNEKSLVTAADSSALIARLALSHSLVIEVPVTSNGTKQFLFASGGFDPAKIGVETTTSDPFLPMADDGKNYDLPAAKAAR